MTEPQATNVLSPEMCEAIDHWTAKFPADQKRSALLPALREIQERNKGSLTEGLMRALADYIEIPEIAVFEVATFYSMYELKPVGRNKLEFCTNVSCTLCGCDELLAHVEKRLGVKPGETTADGKFTVKAVECLGACINAPVVMQGQKYHENLTIAELNKLIDEAE